MIFGISFSLSDVTAYSDFSTNIVPIAVEGWSETEQQHEELGGCKYDEKDGEHTRKGTEGRHIWGLGCRE